MCLCAYDRLPRERKLGVTKMYVRLVHDKYEDNVTAVMCAVGMTNGFMMEI